MPSLLERGIGSIHHRPVQHGWRLGVTRVFGPAGQMAQLTAARQVEHAATTIPKVGGPLHNGRPGFLWKSAPVLTAASLALSLVSTRSRKSRFLASLLDSAGSLTLRLAVHCLGRASARDPRASFEQQRGAVD